MAAQRAIRNALNYLPVGSRARLRGTNIHGVVLHVETNFDKITWEGRRPLLIQFQPEHKEFIHQVSTSQLKRINRAT